MTFSERLLSARKEKGFTQEHIAEAIGVAKSTYTGYEKGNREPDLFKIKKLIEVLGVSSSWLLGLDSSECDISSCEWKMIKKYRTLDERGKENVNATIDREFEHSARIVSITSDAIQTALSVEAAISENLITEAKK